MFVITAFLAIYVSISTSRMMVLSSSSTSSESTQDPVTPTTSRTSTTVENASSPEGTTNTSSVNTLSPTLSPEGTTNTSSVNTLSPGTLYSEEATTSGNLTSPEANTTAATTSSTSTSSPIPTSTSSTIFSTAGVTNATTTVDQTSITPSHPDVSVIAPAVIVPVAVVAIVAVVILLKWRKVRTLVKCLPKDQHQPETSSVGSIVLPEQTSIVVRADEFMAYLKDMQKECDFKYAEQFESLQLIGREQSTDHATLKCNVEKNRYLNIHPYDVTRVKLLPTEGEEGSDYINASWIPGYYSKREYIAAQGPLPSTEDDMWRMVWEYKCRGIIMLTKCMEAGRKKCDQYWPDDSEPVVYGDIQVAVINETTFEEKWSIKKLEISLGQHKRFLNLFHFVCWPDSGVPPSVDHLLDFIQTVNNEIESSRSGPLVIHCSAGVGRTGTYIAIETLLQQLENENQIDVFGVVYRLRMNRVFMVQTESQFKFIHEALGKVICRKLENNLDTSEHQPVDDSGIIVIADEGSLIPVEEFGVNGIDNRGFRPMSII